MFSRLLELGQSKIFIYLLGFSAYIYHWIPLGLEQVTAMCVLLLEWLVKPC